MYKHIKFAFAVSHSNTFEACHFGDADKYLIFEWNGNEIAFHSELINTAKSFDETQEHGSKKKGKTIIELLKNNKIQILVSKQFGLNIKMVNRFFIPIAISNETNKKTLAILSTHINEISDELQKHPAEFKLFTIRKGIFKSTATKKTEQHLL